METQAFVRILGASDATASVGCDHTSFIVGDRILVDVCPSATLSLMAAGIDPAGLEAICFTHLHSDHCMGLAPLLENIWFKKRSLAHLKIYGPAATLRRVYEAVQAFFAACDSHGNRLAPEPELVELEGNARFDLCGFSVSVMDSVHAVPGLCYTFTELTTGKRIGATGDTCYQAAFADFFCDVDLLLHECSYGAGPLPEGNARNRHSSAREAVRVADEAHAKKLLLIHCREPWRREALAYAVEHAAVPVEWATPGRVYRA